MFFSTHIKRKKNYIVHLWAYSGFFDSHEKKKNDIAHLRFCKWFFDFRRRRKEMILHICEPTNGFSTNATMERK
jgi:hypothetical protein